MVFRICIVAFTLLLFAPAYAASPIIHLKFDGSLANSGSNGVQAEAVAPGTRGETPADLSYAEGRFGQGGLFDGTVVLRMPTQLNKDQYGQFTFTGWIYSDEDWDAEAPMIGNGSHLWLNIWGRNVQMRCGKHCVIVHTGTAVPPERWVFIAGIWDAANSKATLYLDQRVASTDEMDLSTMGEASEHLWIGVRDGSNMSMAKSMRFDDFRFYDRALSAPEIADIRRGGGADGVDTGGIGGSNPVVSSPSETGPDIGGSSEIETAKRNTDSAADNADEAPLPTEKTDEADTPEQRVIGWTIDNAQSHRTHVLGDTGGVIRELMLPAGEGMRRIGWQASLRGPCRLRIGADSGSWAVAAGTCQSITRSKDAALSSAIVTSVSVEPNLDRLLIEGAIIDDKGAFGGIEKDETADRDFGQIDPPTGKAECNADHVATGIVAHFERRGNDSTKAVGLALICSKVVKLYSN